MADTTFSPGTTITSDWLNDINDHVYQGKDLTSHDILNVKFSPYNAMGDGVTDDTVAIQTALDYIAVNGGILYIPPGTYMVSKLLSNNTGSFGPFEIRGAGRRRTVIKKISNDTDPIFKLSSSPGVLETYHRISGITFQGTGVAATHTGVELTNYACFHWQDVEVRDCSIGFNLLGVLSGTFKSCLSKDNVTVGIKTQKSSDGIYCNSLTFDEFRVIGNKTFGLDLGQGSGINVTNCDIESNGTLGNTATGAVYLRTNLAEEFGFSLINFKNVWLESNNGWTIQTEGTSSFVRISMNNVQILSTDSGQGFNLTAGRLDANNLHLPSPGTTLNLAATASSAAIKSSTISILTNNVANFNIVNVTTSSTYIRNAMSLPTSSAGLITGDIWKDAGASNVIKQV